MIRLFLVFALALSPIYSQSSLPKQSQILLKNYEDYEKDRVAALNNDLIKVQKQVIDALKKHLKEASSKGNLDASQSLITEIKKWESDTLDLFKPCGTSLPNPWLSGFGKQSRNTRASSLPNPLVLSPWIRQESKIYRVKEGNRMDVHE